MADQPLPILYLTFANDKRESGRMLRNLSMETHLIRKALKGVNKSLYEVIIDVSVSLEMIIDTFQSQKGRIVAFHYGGHADRENLFLETHKGGQAAAYNEGLLSFLGRQDLKLVFLNGCSTQHLAEGLVEQGVPVVIGTSQTVDDELAATMAARFYEALGRGSTIANAWKDAVDEVLANRGKQVTLSRAAGFEGQAGHTASFSWKVFHAPGGQKHLSWNLPEESNNPLFGLDLPKAYYEKLPESPYRGLEPYLEEHAGIFFGRGKEIKKLYNNLESEYNIILYHGQSGVGKSSILSAGLIPRIREAFQVEYVRRDAKEGALKTLESALYKASGVRPDFKLDSSLQTRNVKEELEGLEKEFKLRVHGLGTEETQKLLDEYQLRKDLLKQEADAQKIYLNLWKNAEASFQEGKGQKGNIQSKPLIIILDQVEEAFTIPCHPEGGRSELEELMQALKEVFIDTEEPPQGKLILSFRKEYLADIITALQKYDLSYSSGDDCYLKPLDQDGIIEVVKGIADSPHIPSAKKYSQLQISEGLPELIASDLREDSRYLQDREKGGVAPVLQILLQKMWKAVKDEDEPRFDEKVYDKAGGQGLTEFFEENVASLKAVHPQLVTSGLLYDMLFQFVTPLGTSGSRAKHETSEKYAHVLWDFETLIGWLLRQKFLLEVGEDKEHIALRLIHDSIAPIVKNAYENSPFPGQLSKRILENAIQNNLDLKKEEVAIILRGEKGRKKYNARENALVEEGRRKYLLDIVQDYLIEDNIELALELSIGYFRDREEKLHEIYLFQQQYNSFKRHTIKRMFSNTEEIALKGGLTDQFLQICRGQEIKADVDWLINEIRGLIEESKIEDAVDLLLTQLDYLENTGTRRFIQNIISRHQNLSSYKGHKLLNYSERSFQENRIRHSILKLCEFLEDTWLGLPKYADPLIDLFAKLEYFDRVRKAVLDHVENNELEKSLMAIKYFVSRTEDENLNELWSNIWSRFQTFQRNVTLGLISLSEIELRRLQIADQLLGFTDEIESNYLQNLIASTELNLNDCYKQVMNIQSLIEENKTSESITSLKSLLEKQGAFLGASKDTQFLKEMLRSTDEGKLAHQLCYETYSKFRLRFENLKQWCSNRSKILNVAIGKKEQARRLLSEVIWQLSWDEVSKAIIILKKCLSIPSLEGLKKRLSFCVNRNRAVASMQILGLFERLERSREKNRLVFSIVQLCIELERKVGLDYSFNEIGIGNDYTTLYQKIRVYLSKSDLDGAILMAKSYIPEHSEGINKEIIILSALHFALKQKGYLGIFRGDELAIEKNWLTQELLSFFKEVVENSDYHTSIESAGLSRSEIIALAERSVIENDLSSAFFLLGKVADKTMNEDFKVNIAASREMYKKFISKRRANIIPKDNEHIEWGRIGWALFQLCEEAAGKTEKELDFSHLDESSKEGVVFLFNQLVEIINKEWSLSRISEILFSLKTFFQDKDTDITKILNIILFRLNLIRENELAGTESRKEITMAQSKLILELNQFMESSLNWIRNFPEEKTGVLNHNLENGNVYIGEYRPLLSKSILHIRQNEIDDAISKLKEYTTLIGQIDWHNDLIILHRNYLNLLNDFHNGLIVREKYRSEWVKLIDSIIVIQVELSDEVFAFSPLENLKEENKMSFFTHIKLLERLLSEQAGNDDFLQNFSSILTGLEEVFEKLDKDFLILIRLTQVRLTELKNNIRRLIISAEEASSEMVNLERVAKGILDELISITKNTQNQSNLST